MSADNKNMHSGGVLLAAGIVVGAFIGAMLGQPTIGFLAGTAIGLLLLIIVWLIDRRR